MGQHQGSHEAVLGEHGPELHCSFHQKQRVSQGEQARGCCLLCKSQPVDIRVYITCAASTDISFAMDAWESESLFSGAYIILSLVVWPWSNGAGE